MAVKVRCPQCDKALNAPDAARGKAVKCPDCQARVSVPAEDGDEPVAPAKSAKSPAKAKKKSQDSDDFLGNLDLDTVEDQKVRLCPKCGQRLGEDDEEECPKCGVDVRTGQLTARQKRRRSLKGADPRDYYREAWRDSFAFLKPNWRLGLKLGFFWTFLQTLMVLCLFCRATYCDFSVSPPPFLFWTGLAMLTVLGLPGTYWSLSNTIVLNTLEDKDKPFKVNFDVLQSMAGGLKAVAWSAVLPLCVPVICGIIVVGIIGADVRDQMDANATKVAEERAKRKGAAVNEPVDVPPIEVKLDPPIPVFIFMGAGLCLMTVPFFPVAQVHMTRPYVHKAWLPVDMLVITFKNFGQVMYWHLQAFALLLPAIIGLVLTAVFFVPLLEFYVTNTAHAAVWLAGLMGDSTGSGDRSGFMFNMTLIAVILSSFSLLVLPINLLASFPSVILMRSNGLLGYYCKNNLDLVGKIPKHAPSGFWPRYLAYLIDIALLNFAGSLIGGLGEFVAQGAIWAGMDYFALLARGAASLASIYVSFSYFVYGETSSLQSTLGMRSIGLKVISEDGKRPTFKQAFIRFLLRGVSNLLLFLPFLMAAFTPKKQAMHDSATKTLVVWEGD